MELDEKSLGAHEPGFELSTGPFRVFSLQRKLATDGQSTTIDIDPPTHAESLPVPAGATDSAFAPINDADGLNLGNFDS